MKTSLSIRNHSITSTLLLAFTSLAFGAPSVPDNLGGGLRELVEATLQPPALLPSTRGTSPGPQIRFNPLNSAVRNTDGAILINIVLNGRIPIDQFVAALGANVIEITATNASYRRGIIEGYVDLADVVAIAQAPGVQAVHLVHAPLLNVGATTSQGVVQHRVDKLQNLDGTGIKVGVLSDSFNSEIGLAPLKEADDIASGDLPGAGNPFGRLTPVQVLSDIRFGTDEGRAMLQIVHDVAPGAKLAFATAAKGPVAFARNIRALADAGCNILVDDILYFLDEPMFSDGLVAQTVDAVAAQGVSYFSSAGNISATQAYRGSFKPIGVGMSAESTIPGTNCVLPPADRVDPAEYAGGFHNFSATGIDAAVSAENGPNSVMLLEWDDPWDFPPTTLGAVLLETKGTVSDATPQVDIPFNGSIGQSIAVTVDADSSANHPISDLVVTLLDPLGNVVWFQDTAFIPEKFSAFLSVNGTYLIRVSGFDGVTGDFSVRVNDTNEVPLGPVLLSTKGTVSEATPEVDFHFDGKIGQRVFIFTGEDPASSNPISDTVLTLIDPAGRVVWGPLDDFATSRENLIASLSMNGTYTVRISGASGATGDFIFQINDTSVADGITSDFNLLVFNPDGSFLSAVTGHNFVTRRPTELLQLSSSSAFEVQIVIARANTPPPAPQPAHILHAVFFNGGRFEEHFSYDTPTTFGHSCATGANGVAAYPFFAPFVPESFTSPGSTTIYFDQNNHRLATPEVRLKPDIAAMDGANTTFFGIDAEEDADTFPNFFGTSAAAPHAAAIAALVLQANGGPGSVAPTEMKRVLQQSAFPHDLDPSAANGSAYAGNSRISLAARGDGTITGQLDNDGIRVSLTGPGKLAQITLDLTNANPTQTPRGLVFDARNVEKGGYPFTLGTLVGLTENDVKPTFSSTVELGRYRQLTLSFPTGGSFAGGDSIGFGVDRDEIAILAGGGSASLLGGGVLLPSGTIVGGGASFSGTLEDGTAFSGVFTNRIGKGYSRLDGFGFINAEAAVATPLP